MAVLRRRRFGFVFQAYNLIPELSVVENILMPISLDKNIIDEIYVKEIINALALENMLYNFPNELSGGQQQRVAIARALVT